MTTQMWRVVCEGGEVREVIVEDRGYVSDGRRQYVAGGVYIVSESPRVAVVRWCAMEAHEKAVVELVAPGAQTSDERLAQVTAERDAAVAARDALAGAVREEREARKARESALVAERRARVLDVSADRSAWQTAHDQYTTARVAHERAIGRVTAALTATPVAMVRAEAVREFVDASDALMRASLDNYAAAEREVDAARTALDAALAAAGGV